MDEQNRHALAETAIMELSIGSINIAAAFARQGGHDGQGHCVTYFLDKGISD